MSEYLRLFKNSLLLILLILNISRPQDRYDSFSNWIKQLPEYGYSGMKNAVTDKSNLLIMGGAGLASLAAIKYDNKVQNYAQSKGLLNPKVSRFGDLYGGAWSAWLLPVSVIVTSKVNDESKKEMLQKLDYTASALVANGVTTIVLKELIGRERPNGAGYSSMPSGHTSHSFAVAAVANELYGREIGIAGYLLAGLVGVSRINDNKHYLTDVLIGAGLGTIIGRGFAKTYDKYKSKSKGEFNLSFSINLN